MGLYVLVNHGCPPFTSLLLSTQFSSVLETSPHDSPQSKSTGPQTYFTSTMHTTLPLLPLILTLLTTNTRAGSTGGSRGSLTGSEPPTENSGSDAAFQSLASEQASLAAYAASTSAAYAATAIPPLPWSSQAASGISFGTTNDSLPDPCGPPVQKAAPANSTSTCHVNVSIADTTTPTAYGVQCLNDESGYILNSTTCAAAQVDICDKISAATTVGHPLHDPPVNQWVWSATSGANCTMGFWLSEGGAPVPSYMRCMTQIYQVMMEACNGEGGEGKGGWNGATVNMRNGTTTLADGDKPVVVAEGYASFVLGAWSSN